MPTIASVHQGRQQFDGQRAIAMTDRYRRLSPQRKACVSGSDTGRCSQVKVATADVAPGFDPGARRVSGCLAVRREAQRNRDSHRNRPVVAHRHRNGDRLAYTRSLGSDLYSQDRRADRQRREREPQFLGGLSDGDVVIQQNRRAQRMSAGVIVRRFPLER